MASGKGADSTKSTSFGLLCGFLHFGGPRSRKSRKSTGALEMASGKRADSTKSTNFGLLWGSLHFGGLRSRKSTGALEMASQKKKSGLYKIHKFWAFVEFPPCRRSQKPEIQEINRGLGNGFRKRSGLYKIDKFWAFVWFPSISAVPEAGNPGNPQGPWKWPPEKERTLQNRQVWGFCGVPPPFRRPQKPEIQEINRGLGNGFRKRSGTLQNRQVLGFCGVPSISAVPEAGNPGNPQGPWKWPPEKERTLQNRQVLGFCGVPSISAVPEAGNPGNPQGPWKWPPGKGADSTKIDKFWAFVGFPPFRRPQKPEIQEIKMGLGNGFRKNGLYKIDKFWAFVGFPPFRRPQKPEIQGNPQGPWKWLAEKERTLRAL